MFWLHVQGTNGEIDYHINNQIAAIELYSVKVNLNSQFMKSIIWYLRSMCHEYDSRVCYQLRMHIQALLTWVIPLLFLPL